MLGIQQCYTCEEPVNPRTVYTRFGHKFCSDECRDAYDERNDQGHTKEAQATERERIDYEY